jgi:class 3 adenylate cyclase
MAVSHRAAAYLPMDRRLALLAGEDLPETSQGAVLFADLQGFTALGEALSHTLGPAQGAEELNRRISACFVDLIATLHSYRGAVVSFAGDGLLGVFSGAPARAPRPPRPPRPPLPMPSRRPWSSTPTWPCVWGWGPGHSAAACWAPRPMDSTTW